MSSMYTCSKPSGRALANCPASSSAAITATGAAAAAKPWDPRGLQRRRLRSEATARRTLCDDTSTASNPVIANQPNVNGAVSHGAGSNSGGMMSATHISHANGAHASVPSAKPNGGANVPKRDVPAAPKRAAGMAGIARIVAGTLISGISPKCHATSGNVASDVVVEITTDAISSDNPCWAQRAGPEPEADNGAVAAADSAVMMGRPTITPAIAVKLSWKDRLPSRDGIDDYHRRASQQQCGQSSDPTTQQALRQKTGCP